MTAQADTSIDVDEALKQLRVLAGTARPIRRKRVSIGIINNMPDSALDATARQFSHLLRSATDEFDLRIQMFSLPGIMRTGPARERVTVDYFDFDRLHRMHMDALIVTGTPPGDGALTAEAFWPAFAPLVDWARSHTLSTLWSCLSAHAAVLQLDGITRTRLPAKLSGVFDVAVKADHALTVGLGQKMRVPHSRYNGLDEAALRGSGYEILARSDEVGADTFIKSTPSLFVFFQGHPEYDADTLAREYRRDAIRFIDGKAGEYPRVPSAYFAADVEQGFLDYEARLLASTEGAEKSAMPDPLAVVPRTSPWASSSQRFFRNWVSQVARLKDARSDPIRKAV